MDEKRRKFLMLENRLIETQIKIFEESVQTTNIPDRHIYILDQLYQGLHKNEKELGNIPNNTKFSTNILLRMEDLKQ